jgi:ADP-heptose:LPS heptosyltransferase
MESFEKVWKKLYSSWKSLLKKFRNTMTWHFDLISVIFSSIKIFCVQLALAGTTGKSFTINQTKLGPVKT